MRTITLTKQQWEAFERTIKIAREYAYLNDDQDQIDLVEDFLVNECEEQEP